MDFRFRLGFALVLLLLIGARLRAADAQQLERKTAQDVPLDLSGTSGQERAWLAAFDVPAGTFSYTIELRDREEGRNFYRVVFPSAFQIDAQHIGITGISLGGIMTSLAAGVDGSFDRVVPILAGGNLAHLTFTVREVRRMRAKLQDAGIDEEKFRKIMAPVEPLNFAARIDPKRCLMINALQDEVIPRSTTDALIDKIGKPQVLWAQAGHYSAVLYLPSIRATVARFVSGRTVDELRADIR